MRLLIAAALVAAGAVTTTTSATAIPPVGVNLGYETYSDADSDTSALTSAPDLAVDELAANGYGSGSGCRAQSRVNKASIVYRDAAGLPTFGFFSTISWAQDCRKITGISQVLNAEVYQPQYRFSGYVHRNVSPPGGKTASASGQARFGICQTVVGETCVLERLPAIAWKVYANGKSVSKVTP